MEICSCCGRSDDVQMHHLVPKSLGGSDDLTIPLCFSCHRRTHGLKPGELNHSELTKKGLQAAKARGVKLGGLRQRTADANRVAAVQADLHATKVGPTIIDRRKAGVTYQAIADEFNALGVTTARGGKWHPTTVKNAEARLEGLDGKEPPRWKLTLSRNGETDE